MKARFNIPDDRDKLYQVIHFPAGEIQVRLTEAGIKLVSHPRVDAFEIECNPIPDVIELAQLKDAIQATIWQARATILHDTSLFLPYLPFARADRRFVPGDTHGFGVFMQFIKTMGFRSIWTFDAHNAKLAKMHGIANMLPTDTPIDQINPCIQRMGRDGLVLILPDEGAAKRYDLGKYKLPFLIAEKKRDSATGKLSGFKVGNAIRAFGRGLIIDDICDGGGTFVGLAQAILKKNPKIELGLYVSHGIFSKGSTVLEEAGIKHLYISDYSIKGQDYDQFAPMRGE